jgi:hypothetical protein
MNKPHAAAYRKPVSAPTMQAAIQRTTALVAIGWIAPSPTLFLRALQQPPCETSRDLPLPRFGFPLGGKLSDAAAPLVGLRDPARHPQIEPCAQMPMQREAACPQPASTLRNGNPRGNPNAAPRCGARTRAGCPCRAPAMKNGRCRMHGGASTGPSAEGRARIAAARTIHGRRTAATRALDRMVTATKRRGTVLNAMARAGLRVEDLAKPIRQCRTGPALPNKPSTAARDRIFVMRALMAMAFSAAEVRSLLAAIGAAAPKPGRGEAKRTAQVPMHPEPLPKPPRQSPICERPRQPLTCRRLDPAQPFPARINAHAPWADAETATGLAEGSRHRRSSPGSPSDRAPRRLRPRMMRGGVGHAAIVRPISLPFRRSPVA